MLEKLIHYGWDIASFAEIICFFAFLGLLAHVARKLPGEAPPRARAEVPPP